MRYFWVGVLVMMISCGKKAPENRAIDNGWTFRTTSDTTWLTASVQEQYIRIYWRIKRSMILFIGLTS